MEADVLKNQTQPFPARTQTCPQDAILLNGPSGQAKVSRQACLGEVGAAGPLVQALSGLLSTCSVQQDSQAAALPFHEAPGGRDCSGRGQFPTMGSRSSVLGGGAADGHFPPPEACGGWESVLSFLQRAVFLLLTTLFSPPHPSWWPGAPGGAPRGTLGKGTVPISREVGTEATDRTTLRHCEAHQT